MVGHLYDFYLHAAIGALDCRQEARRPRRARHLWFSTRKFPPLKEVSIAESGSYGSLVVCTESANGQWLSVA